jgi:hypothetical protein
MKLLFWDGQGFCLYYKVLDRGRFVWPSAQDDAVRLTSAQLAMLSFWADMRFHWPPFASTVCSVRRAFPAVYLETGENAAHHGHKRPPQDAQGVSP